MHWILQRQKNFSRRFSRRLLYQDPLQNRPLPQPGLLRQIQRTPQNTDSVPSVVSRSNRVKSSVPSAELRFDNLKCRNYDKHGYWRIAAPPVCPKYGRPFEPEEKFCGSCGAEIEAVRSYKKCAEPLDADTRFCEFCGMPVGPAPVFVPPAVLSAASGPELATPLLKPERTQAPEKGADRKQPLQRNCVTSR